MYLFCFQADLKVVNDAKGGSFYRDHLPLLGKRTMLLSTTHFLAIYCKEYTKHFHIPYISTMYMSLLVHAFNLTYIGHITFINFTFYNIRYKQYDFYSNFHKQNMKPGIFLKQQKYLQNSTIKNFNTS